MTESNSVSAGWGSDLRVTAVAAMTPLLPGLLVLLGYGWLAGFGVLLGLGGGIAWGVWWYRRNARKFFPRDVNTSAFVISIVLTVAALVLILVAT